MCGVQGGSATTTAKKWSTTRYRCGRWKRRSELQQETAAAAAVWVEENSDSVRRRERKALHSQVVNIGREERSKRWNVWWKRQQTSVEYEYGG